MQGFKQGAGLSPAMRGRPACQARRAAAAGFICSTVQVPLSQRGPVSVKVFPRPGLLSPASVGRRSAGHIEVSMCVLGTGLLLGHSREQDHVCDVLELTFSRSNGDAIKRL